MGTELSFSTAYHPQTSGQTERVNQVMEDLLRACVLSYGKNWEKSGPKNGLSPDSDQFNGVLHAIPYKASKGDI